MDLLWASLLAALGLKDVLLSFDALNISQADTAIPDKLKGGKVLIFPINNDAKFVKESQVVVDNGGPLGEELASIALYGEYNCSTSPSLPSY